MYSIHDHCVYLGITTLSTGIWNDDFLIRTTNAGDGWYSSLSEYNELCAMP